MSQGGLRTAKWLKYKANTERRGRVTSLTKRDKLRKKTAIVALVAILALSVPVGLGLATANRPNAAPDFITADMDSNDAQLPNPDNLGDSTTTRVAFSAPPGTAGLGHEGGQNLEEIIIRETNVYIDCDYPQICENCLRSHNLSFRFPAEHDLRERVITETNRYLEDCDCALSTLIEDIVFEAPSMSGTSTMANANPYPYPNPPSKPHCIGFSMTWLSSVVEWTRENDTYHEHLRTDRWGCDRPGCDGVTDVDT